MARWSLRRPALTGVFALVLAPVLAVGEATACAPPPGWTGGERIVGTPWTAWWRSEPASIPVSEHFSIHFHLCGPPVDRVAVRGWMPDHRHEMNYRPAVTLNESSGAAEGLLFHMPGRWQLILEVRGPAGRENLTAETVLE